MIQRDGHIRILPIHVANKIAAGEVIERPASVVKELVENSIDSGAHNIHIAITAGGRKLVAVQDDGCGMSKDDVVLSLERQATSKILDVNDIEQIATLGFRGEAIPSIASVSRFSITSRTHSSDEGTFVQVNAGILAEVSSAGCPPGTLVEVRDLFCNVPARRKFLRAYATEEGHVKAIFTMHALAHSEIGFALTIDGREIYRLAPASSAKDRICDLFGADFFSDLLELHAASAEGVSVSGFIERPNLSTPTRRDQFVFVNGRPATAPSIVYALREAYPRQLGDARPAVILFLTLPPEQVDVNVHPTKREVRFRDSTAVKRAVVSAVESALRAPSVHAPISAVALAPTPAPKPSPASASSPEPESMREVPPDPAAPVVTSRTLPFSSSPRLSPTPVPTPSPIPLEFAIEPDSTQSRPWQWFKFLAQSASGYLLIETDAGIVTINPHAARERIVFERLLSSRAACPSQTLLIPDTVRLSPPDFARVKAAQEIISSMGFQLEEFGVDTFKIDAVPQIIGNLSPSSILSTIARDLSEGSSHRVGERWRDELIAKSIARSFAGASKTLDEKGACQLVEDLCACRMPYVCPRGKRIMIFTSTRELDRKFERV